MISIAFRPLVTLFSPAEQRRVIEAEGTASVLDGVRSRRILSYGKERLLSHTAGRESYSTYRYFVGSPNTSRSCIGTFSGTRSLTEKCHKRGGLGLKPSQEHEFLELCRLTPVEVPRDQFAALCICQIKVDVPPRTQEAGEA